MQRDYSDWTAFGDPRSEQVTEVPTTDTYSNGDRHGQPDLQLKVEEPPLEPIPEKFGDEVTSEAMEIP